MYPEFVFRRRHTGKMTRRTGKCRKILIQKGKSMRRPVKVTLQSIAAETGVSAATVSRALANSDKISPETRRRILLAARRAGYRSDSRAVALIVPDFSFSGYFGTLLAHFHQELVPAGFRPVVLSSHCLELIEEQEFCGAISIFSLSGLESYWGRRHIMPLVCINTAPRHLDGIFTVGSNDAQGMRLALEHLLRLGHRKIGRLGGTHSFDNPQNWNSFARDRTFREIMAAHKLEADLIADAGPAGGCAEALRPLLKRGITALIILNEDTEIDTLHALRLMDCRVPEDLSVVAWSQPGVGSKLHPALTTLEQDFPMLARRGCDIFRKLLNGESVSGDVLVDYHFTARASTAQARL